MVLALAAAASLLVVGLRRRTRGSRWTAELDGAVGETRRVSRDVVPFLLGQTREARRAAWQVARADAVAAEVRLADLARSAPDEDRATEARRLAEGLSELRASLDAESQAPEERAAAALDSVRAAAIRLDERLALRPPPEAPGTA